MDCGYLRTISFVCRGVSKEERVRDSAVKIVQLKNNKRVSCSGSGVVGETESVPIATSPFVENALVATIPRGIVV